MLEEREMEALCPCGSGREYADCCQPLLAGRRPAATAEALMRSRYSAFVKNDAAYLERTLLPRRRSAFDAREMLAWNADVAWTGLRVLATEAGGVRDGEGVVEFVAAFVKAGETREVREVSRFKRKNGLWYYVDGKAEDAADQAKAATEAPAPKVGRNAPCPCGSGRKFKHCCG